MSQTFQYCCDLLEDVKIPLVTFADNHNKITLEARVKEGGYSSLRFFVSCSRANGSIVSEKDFGYLELAVEDFDKAVVEATSGFGRFK